MSDLPHSGKVKWSLGQVRQECTWNVTIAGIKICAVELLQAYLRIRQALNSFMKWNIIVVIYADVLYYVHRA